MAQALLVRLYPVTPWRFGAESGAPDQSDSNYHSDSLYSALCSAFLHLGQLDEWLKVTIESPGIRFSSCFPFLGETLFVPPPRTMWPPGHSSKLRWKGARFVPLTVVKGLLAGELPSEDGWIIDSFSGCLLPVGRGGAAVGPFRLVTRTSAPVDRLTGQAGAATSCAVAQFSQNAGLWFVATFAAPELEPVWAPRLEGALRWLADSGFGGLRSRGFGRCAAPVLTRGEWPSLLVNVKGEARAWWLLSLFAPADGEPIDWTQGDYETVSRGGRIESASGWGALKKTIRMVREGSVLAAAELSGSARNVAPEGFPHPVYRAGFALSVPIPAKGAE